MKRRLTKKWLKRYINPLIADLQIVGWSMMFEVDIGNEQTMVYQAQNHSIKNGYVVPEGMIAPPSTGMRKDIMRAAENIRRIRESHDHVFLRWEPRLNEKRLYMRLITESKVG